MGRSVPHQKGVDRKIGQPPKRFMRDREKKAAPSWGHPDGGEDVNNFGGQALHGVPGEHGGGGDFQAVHHGGHGLIGGAGDGGAVEGRLRKRALVQAG